MIRLRFVTSDRTLVSRGIQAAQYGFWASHVEAVMPEGTLLGAHAGEGVQNRPADYDAGEWTRQEFVDLAAPDDVSDGFHCFMRAEIGKPYDLTAIVAFLAGRDWREPDSWFCSELVMTMLERVNVIRPLATEANHVTPRDCRIVLSAVGGITGGIVSAQPGSAT